MEFFASSRQASAAMEARRATAEVNAYAVEVIELCQKLGRPGYAATAIRCQERDHLRREVAKRTTFAPTSEAAVASWESALARAAE